MQTAVEFKMILPSPQVTGDNAGREPGSFRMLLAQVSGPNVTIASNQEAYFYVPVNYSIGEQVYTQLSWKVKGPAMLASVEGIVYTLADSIIFQGTIDSLSGSIYIRNL